jgi:hypothetical protein
MHQYVSCSNGLSWDSVASHFFFLIDALDFTPVYESLITSMEIYEWGYAFHYKIFLAILNHSFKVEMVSYSNKTSLKFWIAFLGRNS